MIMQLVLEADGEETALCRHLHQTAFNGLERVLAVPIHQSLRDHISQCVPGQPMLTDANFPLTCNAMTSEAVLDLPASASNLKPKPEHS